MTLASHAVVGAVIAKIIPGYHPIIQFAFGFISHFLIDAIPHGHYQLIAQRTDPNDPHYSDMPFNKKSFGDFAKIGLDLLLGFGISFLALSRFGGSSYLTIGLGAFGGILPDALQFVYWKIRKTPLKVLFKDLQHFHLEIMHSKKLLDKNQPLTYLVEAVAIIISLLIALI